MFKKQNYILLIVLLFIIASCDSLKRGLTGQKQKNTDEFLVRKKDPLILPPNYEFLPTPGEKSRAKINQSEFEKLISEDSDAVDENLTSSTSVENNILKKIKKNR